jgi:hypothetical protein
MPIYLPSGFALLHLVLADPNALAVHQHLLGIDRRLRLLFGYIQRFGNHGKKPFALVFVLNGKGLFFHLDP